MKLEEFVYELPERLIAQTPVEPRDASRLLVLNRQDGSLNHRHFYDMIDYLEPGDVLVVNRTKVLPARLWGRRPTGGLVEVLLVQQVDLQHWKALVKPGKKARPGDRLDFGEGLLAAEVEAVVEEGLRLLRFEYQGNFMEILDQLGTMPLPPYIHEQLEDQNRYQCVYAKDPGSAAAPTAGLHFTEQLLERIEAKGVRLAEVLLNVGLGTFRPVKVENIEEHQMHAEFYQVTPETAELGPCFIISQVVAGPMAAGFSAWAPPAPARWKLSARKMDWCSRTAVGRANSFTLVIITKRWTL